MICFTRVADLIPILFEYLVHAWVMMLSPLELLDLHVMPVPSRAQGVE